MSSNFFLALLGPMVTAAVLGCYWIYAYLATRPRGPVVVRYQPPEHLSAAEIGVMVVNQFTMRIASAMLVDLASCGYVGMRRVEGASSPTGQPDYVCELLRPGTDWGELRRGERDLLAYFFHTDLAGATALLSSVEGDLADHMLIIWQSVRQGLSERGFLCPFPPYAVLNASFVGMAVGAFFGMGALIASNVPTWVTLMLWNLAGIGAILFFGLQRLPHLTPQGSRLRLELLGFREFMQRAESDEIKRTITDPAHFDRYLAYAMALRIEDRWSKIFAQLYQDPESRCTLMPVEHHDNRLALEYIVVAARLNATRVAAAASGAQKPAL